MSLEKEFIRDGKRRIIGSVTSGFSDDSRAVVRDEDNKSLGSHQRTVRHYPRRPWQFGLNQHRRSRSLDRQAQVVAESVPQPPPSLPPSWRSI